MERRKEMRYIQYYVGSAAPKLILPPAPKKKSSLPKDRKEKTYTFPVDPLALAGIVVSAAMLVLMVVGFLQLRTARQELAQMTNYVNALQAENVRLDEKYHESYDLEMVENAALGLGMIPVEEAQHITIAVEKPVQQDITLWERISSFLVGLFA